MRKDDSTLFRLESLKGKMCLGNRIDRSSWIAIDSVYLYYLCGWEEKAVKPMFGKERIEIVKLKIISSEFIDTEYVGAFDSDLDIHLNRMENDRKLFEQLYRELIKFNYSITEKKK